jgi:predicted RNA methylase
MLSLVTLSLSFLVTIATAQNSAVTWLEPGPAAGAFSYAGAVLDACPGTTVIALQCTAAGADNAYTDICGTDGPVRLNAANPCARLRVLTLNSP